MTLTDRSRCLLARDTGPMRCINSELFSNIMVLVPVP